ncbi:MAG: N-6 DNA methylase, partial [Gilvibacter sp.]
MTEEKTTHVTDFATAPRRVAEFITPFDLCAAIVAVLKPESHEVIYDGAFGTASLLLSVQEYLTKSGASNSENICGREINLNNYETGCKRADAVGLETENLLLSNSLEVNGKDAGKYDVILSNPPLGSKGELREGELGFKTRSGDNKLLQHYINSLKLGGRAAIVVTNGFFSQSDPASVGIRKYLIEHCDLHTVLQLPPNTLQYTAIPISVIFFNKGKNTSNIRYYLKNKEEGYVEFLELINKNTTNKRSYYYNVDCIHDNSFTLPTASQIAIQQEIDEKIGNFKEFKRHKNEKVFLEINLTKEKFEEKSNTVYLPKLGYSPCVTCIGRTTLKHQNYFQLVVDSNIILPGYLVYYLRSNLGQMILDGLKTGVAIPTISKKNLIENLTIFAP